MRNTLPIDIALAHPHAAWLLVLLPLVWWKVGRPVATAHRVIRTAIFAAIVLALAQPSLIHRSDGVRRIVIVNGLSLPDAGRRAQATAVLRRLLARAAPDDRVTLIALGRVGDDLVREHRIDERIAIADGSLSAALERALEQVPAGAGGSVVAIGDGRSTDTHWERAIAGLIRRGIAVSSVGIDGATPGAFIADLRVAPVRVGEQAQATITVDGDGATQRVALYEGTRQVAASAPFVAGPGTVVTLTFPAERAGFVPLRAVLSGNAARGVATVVAVQEPARILYLGERQQGAPSRLRALLGPGFAVDAPAPAAVGEQFDFGAYRAVLLDDLPATRLPAAVQRRLLDQVAGAGMGLFYSGGAQAFGTGGYAGTPLADALPVTLRQDQKLEQPSVALAIVIDTSGSMVGPPLDLAKQVARFAVRRLTPIDSVGVVEFYGAKQWAVPFQPARDVPAVERAIARMQAQGSSILFPAIQEAYFALRNSNARYRHILVVTDAGVEEQRYQSLLTQIARDRIAVSTALVGPDAQGEERMAQWARWGGGRYYAVPDEFSLVELNLTQPQDKPSPGYRRGRFALTPPAGRARWQGVAMTQVPSVAGYVPVGRRAAAETLLSTASGDPMLATWPYGNGRITALMTEPLGEGTRGWAGWSGYGRWLAGILARTADPQADAELSVERRFDQVTVTLRGAPRADGAMPQVRLVAADGRDLATVTMEERAPGWFVGTQTFPSARAALVEARWGGRTIRAADRAGSDVSPMDAIPTANRLPLDALARATGGVHAAGPDAPFAPPRPSGRELAATALWPWLALAALALYLLDILYRRWPGRRRLTGRPAR